VNKFTKKDQCPICGAQIEEVTEDQTNYCSQLDCHGPFFPEELISEDDDYAWCL